MPNECLEVWARCLLRPKYHPQDLQIYKTSLSPPIAADFICQMTWSLFDRKSAHSSGRSKQEYNPQTAKIATRYGNA
jgi:hypothetical protein